MLDNDIHMIWQFRYFDNMNWRLKQKTNSCCAGSRILSAAQPRQLSSSLVLVVAFLSPTSHCLENKLWRDVWSHRVLKRATTMNSQIRLKMKCPGGTPGPNQNQGTAVPHLPPPNQKTHHEMPEQSFPYITWKSSLLWISHFLDFLDTQPKPVHKALGWQSGLKCQEPYPNIVDTSQLDTSTQHLGKNTVFKPLKKVLSFGDAPTTHSKLGSKHSWPTSLCWWGSSCPEM